MGSWQGGVSDGTTLWFVNFDFTNLSQSNAIAYTASNQARDSSKDISLGDGILIGSLSDNTTLWFIDFLDNDAVAYTASTRARDSSKDITLGDGDWDGGVSDNTTLWFVEDDNNNAVCLYSINSGT